MSAGLNLSLESFPGKDTSGYMNSRNGQQNTLKANET